MTYDAEGWHKIADERAAEIVKLRGALTNIHDSMLEYSAINRLGGHNNHELRRARVALGLDEWLDIKDVEARFPPKS